MNEQFIIKYISMEVWFLIAIIFFATTIVMIAIRIYYFIPITLLATITAGKIAFNRWGELENGY